MINADTILRRVIILAACLVALTARATDHAVVLVYHHIAADTPASTSVTPDTFARHLNYLADEGFQVWSLSRVLTHLDNPEGIPDDVVAITFDDAYESVFTTAYPMLNKRGWPFTVFVSTDYLDGGYSGYLSWDQLRTMAADGVEVGNHSKSHRHLIRREASDSFDSWRNRVVEDIDAAQARIDAEIPLGTLQVFAYPYGEFNRELEDIVRDSGYVAFGQQSGVSEILGSRTRMPRFPVATGFDGPEDFAVRVRARPLPVDVVSPSSRVLEAGSEPPLLKLRLFEGGFRRAGLACYATGQGRIPVTWETDEAFTTRADQPLGAGRRKYNCTAPSTTQRGEYYWYSHLWISPFPDGSWYAD